MKSVKIILSVFAVLAISLGIRAYDMTRVRPISLDRADQSPYFLSKNNILYFDNFNDERLVKYREFLNKHRVNDIADIDERVIYIAHLIKSPNHAITGAGRGTCRRSLINLSLMLSSISIYTRHWHASYQNNIGFHQFTEYYNPQKAKWIIMDAYSGIQYEKDGQLLSVSEVVKLILEGQDIEELFKLHNIPWSSFNDTEMKKAWSHRLILARANDYISYYDPEIKYGFLGKVPHLDRLPEKIKKPLRIFGRNNNLLELFNFKKPK